MRRTIVALGISAAAGLAGCGSEPTRQPDPVVIVDSDAEWKAEQAKREAAKPPKAEPITGSLRQGMSEVEVKAVLGPGLVEPGERTIGDFVLDVYQVKGADTVSSVTFKNGKLVGWKGPATVAEEAALGALRQEQPVTVTPP